jgi:hypothetical protein
MSSDDLGASRAGKPANSPVGAISRRHGSVQPDPRRFFLPRARRETLPRLYPIRFRYSMLQCGSFISNSAAKLRFT